MPNSRCRFFQYIPSEWNKQLNKSRYLYFLFFVYTELQNYRCSLKLTLECFELAKRQLFDNKNGLKLQFFENSARFSKTIAGTKKSVVFE